MAMCRASVRIAIYLLIAIALGGGARAQSHDIDITQQLTVLSNEERDPIDAPLEMGVISCGPLNRWTQRKRDAARLLIARGETVLPALAAKLDEIAAADPSARKLWGREWLLFTYAATAKRTGVARILEFRMSPDPRFPPSVLDTATAIALGMTSFVSPIQSHARRIRCQGGFDPQDALDARILTVVRRGRNQLRPGVGVGYRIASLDDGAVPAVLLVSESDAGIPSQEYPQMGTFSRRVTFLTQSGKPCGTRDIRFTWLTADGQNVAQLQVADADPAPLTRQILTCFESQ